VAGDGYQRRAIEAPGRLCNSLHLGSRRRYSPRSNTRSKSAEGKVRHPVFKGLWEAL
jgi:hypothetical protein